MYIHLCTYAHDMYWCSNVLELCSYLNTNFDKCLFSLALHNLECRPAVILLVNKITNYRLSAAPNSAGLWMLITIAFLSFAVQPITRNDVQTDCNGWCQTEIFPHSRNKIFRNVTCSKRLPITLRKLHYQYISNIFAWKSIGVFQISLPKWQKRINHIDIYICILVIQLSFISATHVSQWYRQYRVVVCPAYDLV